MEQHDTLGDQIAQLVNARLGAQIVAAATPDAVMLSGIVPSRHDRDVAESIATAMAGNKRVENLLEIENSLPAGVDAEPSPTRDASGHSSRTTQDEIVDDLNPEFTGQPIETTPSFASGDFIFTATDEAEPDPVYYPPTDPPTGPNLVGNLEVINGFAPGAEDDTAPVLSAEDNIPGDEALIAAIQRQLHEDAATTKLAILVQVENGVAYLRGPVPTLDDAKSAEAVAARVPGVRDVVEELDIATL